MISGCSWGLVFAIPETWAGLSNPPWPSLTDTIVNLEHRWRPAAAVVLAGLVILLFHLALPPWPDMR